MRSRAQGKAVSQFRILIVNPSKLVAKAVSYVGTLCPVQSACKRFKSRNGECVLSEL